MSLEKLIEDNVNLSEEEKDLHEIAAINKFAIAFHNWMRKNDTSENAEKFFHYTDEDMLNVFKEETGW